MSITDDFFKQGLAAYQAEDYAEAESAFLKVLEYETYSSESMLNLGNVYFKQNNLTEAEAMWLNTINANPIEEKAYLNLGNLYYSQQHYVKAAYYWEIFKKMSPLHAHINLNLGLAYEAMGEMPMAYKNYNVYLQTKGMSVEGHQLKAKIEEAKIVAEHNLQQAEHYMRSGQLQKARQAFEQSVNLMPLHAKMYKHYATVLYELNDATEAARWYEKAYQEDAQDTGTLINLGVIYEKLGEPFQALWAYGTAIKLDPHGISGKVKQRYDNILDQFAGPALLDKQLETVRNHIQAAHYAEAERLAQRLFDVAFCETPQKLGDIKALMQFLLDRKDPEKLAADIAYAMAEDFRASGQYEKALQFYDRYLKLFPEGSKAADIRDKQDQIQKVISAVIGSLLSPEASAISAA